jgi:hypothetical protein
MIEFATPHRTTSCRRLPTDATTRPDMRPDLGPGEQDRLDAVSPLADSPPLRHEPLRRKERRADGNGISVIGIGRRPIPAVRVVEN